MRKSVVALTALMLPLSAMAAKYELDSAHTYPNFTINHLGFSTSSGMFTDTKGTMELDLDKKTGSVDVTIATESVFTGFKKRDEHLRSPDFFNVAEFPTMTFKSTSVKFKGSSAAAVEGNLTLMGVTKKVTLDVDNINCGTHPFNKKEVCGMNATTSFKRSDFGMKYGLPAIGDDVTIRLQVEGVKQ